MNAKTKRKVLISAMLVAGLSLWPAAQSQTAPSGLQHGYYRGMAVVYHVVDGLAVAEGDIILGPEEALTRSSGSGDATRRQAVARDAKYLWPGGIIPFEIDGQLPIPTRVLDAIAHWNSRTPIKLQARAGEADYLKFVPAAENCLSSIGRIGGMQTIQLAAGCGTGTVIHEIGHTVGLYHEQSRQDRDEFVDVQIQNIQAQWVGQFLQPFGAVDVGDYDYGSIMHYSSASYSKNGEPTIVTIPPGIPIGTATALSAGDLDAVERLYRGVAPTVRIGTNPPGLEFYVDGNRYSSQAELIWVPGSSHNLSVPQTQEATSELRWSFARWSDGGAKDHSVRYDGHRTAFTANFRRLYRLAVEPVDSGEGRVSANPASPEGFYPEETEVELVAQPAPGYWFLNWDVVRAGAIPPGQNPVRVMVRSRTRMAARFTPTPTTTVTANVTGMLVRIDGEDVRVPANFAWAPGGSHTLQLVPPEKPDDSGIRYWPTGWQDVESLSRTIVASGSPATYTAVFRKQFLVTASASGQYGGGSVAVSPPSTDGFYAAGSTVEFSAQTTTGNVLAYWTGSTAASQNPLRLAVESPLNLTATFLPKSFLHSGSVFNSASLQQQALSPGGLFTILGAEIGPTATAGAEWSGGRLSRELSGTRVLIDGKPVPLLYVSPGQINAIVPFDTPTPESGGRAVVSLRIETPVKDSDAINVVTADAAPAVFTMNGTGIGRGAILNPDYSVNSPANPVNRGSYLVVFMAGLGKLQRPVDDGAIVSSAVPASAGVIARLDGRRTQVYYAGAAPGLVAGAYQVNVLVPEDASPGSDVPLEILAAGVRSPLIPVAVK